MCCRGSKIALEPAVANKAPITSKASFNDLKKSDIVGDLDARSDYTAETIAGATITEPSESSVEVHSQLSGSHPVCSNGGLDAPNREHTLRLLGASKLIYILGLSECKNNDLARSLELHRAGDFEGVWKICTELAPDNAAALFSLIEQAPFGEITKFIDNRSTGFQAGIGISESLKKIIIAFRGTESPTDELQDLLHDLRFLQVPWKPGSPSALLHPDIRVHAGFLHQYRQPETPGDTPPNAQLLNEVARLRTKHPDFEIEITGHSLGAALATLMAFEVAVTFPGTPLLLVTFGSPRIGNKAFKDAFSTLTNCEAYRFQHGLDVVARVPCVGYHHVGRHVWLHDATVALNESAPIGATLPVFPFCCNILGEARDHFLSNYLVATQESETWFETADGA